MKLSEESILKLLEKKTSRPLKIAEMVKHLSIPDVQRREFRNRIKGMVETGSLVKIRGGRYGLPDQMNLVSGVLKGHPNGFGFVVRDKPSGENDIFISRNRMGEAMHLDHVTVRIESGRDPSRPEGRVIRILQRNTASLVGTYEAFGREGWVIPKEPKYFHDVFVPAKFRLGAKTGHVVLVEIENYPTAHQPPVGRVTEVLGYSDDPQVEVRSIFRKYGIHQDFSPDILHEAEHVSAPGVEEARDKRQDLSQWTIFTIDGEKAKDFDDAVSLEMLEEGVRLGVHIADVSHYVRENSALDREAYDRGTSIYYPDGVMPMLPFALSNEACSLKPQVKRLTLTVLMDFDSHGVLFNSKIFNSIIVSKFRFTYTEVARLLKKGDPEKKYGTVRKTLKAMRDLSRLLRKRRFKSGSVDFKIPETEIHMDAKGKVLNIVRAEHNEAHELIEEFMLAANQEVAKFLSEKDIPSIHRIHERPDEDKLADFQQFVLSFGLKIKSSRRIRSIDLQNLLLRVLGRPEERTVNMLLLRTLKKAQYSETDPGHFCLGFKHYTHFTSPIRRYPDLITHRLVKSFLKRKCTHKERKQLLPLVADCAAQSTQMEQKAVAIEREVNDLRRAQFMLGKIGKVYTGIIINVTAFGFYVELTEVFVQGLVRVSGLTDDYYIYIEPEHKLQGQRRHRIFKIGAPVQVRVQNVDISNRTIELALVKKL